MLKKGIVNIMTFEQLEHFFIEQGFFKIPSNLPEFTFFFREENAYVNVLHVIDYKQGLYISQDQYEHLKKTIRDFFVEKGVKEVHILSLLISTDTEKAKLLCKEDAFCWLIDPQHNRLIIHENQIADFYGMKNLLEDFLFGISTSLGEEQILSTNTELNNKNHWKQDWKNWPWVNLLLVLVNVILFIICTFTGNLLYNIGAFSVLNLIQDGEWYRIITSMFLHWDVEHLISNMLVLYYIGNAVEKQMGHIPYAVTYFLSGISGAVLSMGYELLTHDFASSAGASGAVFGIEGALLMLVLLHRGKWADMTAGRVVFTIAFSLYCGFTSSFVNNAAHVGGVLMGFLVTGIFWLLIPEIRNNQKRGNLFQ